MLRSYDVKMIDVDDWDDFVSKTYNRPYCFQQQDGCKDRGIKQFSVPMRKFEMEDFENDEIPVEINGITMGVSFKAWLDKDIKDKFFEDDFRNKLFWDRNFYPHFSMIVNDLYNKGLIEKGDYIISIDW